MLNLLQLRLICCGFALPCTNQCSINPLTSVCSFSFPVRLAASFSKWARAFFKRASRLLRKLRQEVSSAGIEIWPLIPRFASWATISAWARQEQTRCVLAAFASLCHSRQSKPSLFQTFRRSDTVAGVKSGISNGVFGSGCAASHSASGVKSSNSTASQASAASSSGAKRRALACLLVFVVCISTTLIKRK